jgi:hydrogenase/urease accessory protein HupE
MRRIAIMLIFAWLCPAIRDLEAHPVAQGAMDIVVAPSRITIRARVANEQVFVAEGLGKAPASGSLEEAWDHHADYLIEHLQVDADGVRIRGRVTMVAPPETSAPDGRAIYELRYEIPTAHPRRVLFRQNVLNEIEFAPGNRWEATYVVRLQQEGGPVHEGLLFTSRQGIGLDCEWDAAKLSEISSPTIDRARLAREYLRHGVMHILTGYDHLLFVAALVLGALTIVDLLKVVTAFTIAHTLTLTLSVLELVRLPSRIVEPIIAASIVIVALQNVFWPERSRGWTRLIVAFAFGLFHGLGFAGGLLDAMAGMPGLVVGLAIAMFSLGVEMGHAAVVIPLFGMLSLATRATDAQKRRVPIRRTAQQFGSAAICFAGMFYLVAALR